jgi:Flp pilus assembly protein TadG
MRKLFAMLIVSFVAASLSWAADQVSHATIVSQTSVSCGTKNKNKKQSTDILCQQYTVRTDTTEYQIRQQKPGDMDIIPPNTPIDFTLNKNKMKFKANGKKYEFLIVGTLALPPATKP